MATAAKCDDSLGEEEEDADSEVIVIDKLTSIWDDDKVSKFTDGEGNRKWKCLWCKCTFGSWNSTKAVAHLNKTQKKDIKPCRALIDATHRRLYEDLNVHSARKRDRSTVLNEAVDRSIDVHNSSSAVALEKRKSGKKSRKSEISSNLLPIFKKHSTSTDADTVSIVVLLCRKNGRDFEEVEGAFGQCRKELPQRKRR
jgi:hypothetical protein